MKSRKGKRGQREDKTSGIAGVGQNVRKRRRKGKRQRRREETRKEMRNELGRQGASRKSK